MDASAQRIFNKMIELADIAGNLLEIEEMGKAARFEMGKYLMYLSASDGEIKYSEAKIISEVLDINVNPGNVNDIIREHNIYSVEFENTAPAVFKALVEVDNMLYKRGELEEDESSSELMLAVYKGIGMELINADGDVDENERNDILIFINMLEEYLNENLLIRSSGIKFNNTKSSGSVSAPTKSGVSAPKKG